MQNELVSRIVGSFLGAALIVAGFALFGPAVSAVHSAASAQAPAAMNARSTAD